MDRTDWLILFAAVVVGTVTAAIVSVCIVLAMS